ncbi:glycosyl transferase [Erythrobacter sp. SG61-1L]|uniref:glycosyltransferase family 2 protein n=1 Tax=Erythrobacter sp. SG61-1L TaxID=1603897 RepID=UPI0006C8E8ED|nr:glycosyltransferase family 2 protein [Erythrobacter sp. SG61-1L]KPL66844.1 glycosyl transferase [Erythrobacter sp. SG61-1L]
MTRPELSIVIPCFNEQENVRAICAAVTLEAQKAVRSHEIVLIDNCSTDDTRRIIRQLCREDGRIRAIFNSRNYGQMRSPTYGIYQASGQAVIGMCADFQDPPEMIGRFVEEWRKGAQVVLGQRRSEPSSLVLRMVRKAGYAFLSRFGDQPIIPGATGFGLFDRKVVDALAAWNEPEPFFRGMLVEVGFRLTVIPFDRPPRAAGESKNGFRTLFSFAMSALAGSTRSLLRLPLFAAGFFGLATLGLVISTLVALFLGGPAGELALFGLATASMTLIMLCMGLVAEQVRLLSERSRNVPLVIEDERINFPAGAQ